MPTLDPQEGFEQLGRGVYILHSDGDVLDPTNHGSPLFRVQSS
jgi:hypothetical protein